MQGKLINLFVIGKVALKNLLLLLIVFFKKTKNLDK